MSDIVPRRRTLLASAAVLPLLAATAGCRSSDMFAGPNPLADPPPLSHDVLALQAVIAAEERLVELYRAAVAGPQATARSRMLGSLLAQHEQHLARLRARLIEPAGQPSPTPSRSAGPTAGAGLIGIAALRDAERASAAGLVRRLATVQPALAQLFASIAASDATHAAALGG